MQPKPRLTVSRRQVTLPYIIKEKTEYVERAVGKKIGRPRCSMSRCGGSVTLIEAAMLHTQVRLPEKEGYAAVQLGFGERPKRLTGGQLGHLKKSERLRCVFARFRIKPPNSRLAISSRDMFGLGERVE